VIHSEGETKVKHCSYQMNGKYYFLFKNDDDRKFKGIFKFTLTNLRIEIDKNSKNKLKLEENNNELLVNLDPSKYAI
jgi:alpha-acetolactate decarboxylase